MQKENSVLISALVLIIVIGFVGVTYSKMTGESIRPVFSNSKIYVSPSEIGVGGEISVIADPGCSNQRIDQGAWHVIDAKGKSVQSFSFPITQDKAKKVTLSSTIPTGKYLVRSPRNGCTNKEELSNVFRIAP